MSKFHFKRWPRLKPDTKRMDLYFSAKSWLADMYKIFLVRVCVGISVGQWQEGTPYGDIVNNTYKPF